MTKDQIDAIIALHKNAVNSAKATYKEAENDCRENTFMDSGEADSYINYVEGIEAVMEILDLPFPDWELEDDEEDEEDESYESQFGTEMAIRICRANDLPLSYIEKYGSEVYWINDGLNNLQDLYDINENYVIPTGDKQLIEDYKKEFLEEEE